MCMDGWLVATSERGLLQVGWAQQQVKLMELDKVIKSINEFSPFYGTGIELPSVGIIAAEKRNCGWVSVL